MRETYTYDDVQLVPMYSDIQSRNHVNLETRLSKNYNLKIPYVASPMDTVCELEMAEKMASLGGVGCIHRFMSIEEQCNQIRQLQGFLYNNRNDEIYRVWQETTKPIMAAIGVGESGYERGSKLVENGCNVLLIDVAHGHHKKVKDLISKLKTFRKNYKRPFDIIAGNIATSQAAEDLIKWGADGLRVGIGGGCFTPEMEVRTKDGLKLIKDVEIGDEVYTHTGELKPVINKFEYDDYDEVYDIDGIEATGNHKFYVVHQSKSDLVDDGNIHEYAEWVKAEDLTDEYLLIEL